MCGRVLTAVRIVHPQRQESVEVLRRHAHIGDQGFKYVTPLTINTGRRARIIARATSMTRNSQRPMGALTFAPSDRLSRLDRRQLALLSIERWFGGCRGWPGSTA